MIFYRLIDGDAHTTKIEYRPRTCFLMTQLSSPIPEVISEIRRRLNTFFTNHDLAVIDAQSVITGRDFLMKIWTLLLGVPLGIAIIHREMSPQTLSNIFYEIGIIHATGKESLIVKTEDTKVPSDFVRTEYLDFNQDFEDRLGMYLESFFNQAEYYASVADQLENNPLLAIDYLRRAYLISGDETYRLKAHEIFADASIEGRARNSVEVLLANF